MVQVQILERVERTAVTIFEHLTESPSCTCSSNNAKDWPQLDHARKRVQKPSCAGQIYALTALCEGPALQCCQIYTKTNKGLQRVLLHDTRSTHTDTQCTYVTRPVDGLT